MKRYYENDDLKVSRIAKDTVVAAVVGTMLLAWWPLRTVPTGHRGVITVGGGAK